MHRARLECLVITIRRNLVLLFLLMFVIVMAVIAVVATLLVVVLMKIHPALSAVTAITPMMLVRNIVDLLLVMLIKRLARLAFCAILNLMLVFLCKGAINYLQVEDVLKVFCNRLEHLVAKMLPTFNVLGAVLGVERHVGPLNL